MKVLTGNGETEADVFAIAEELEGILDDCLGKIGVAVNHDKVERFVVSLISKHNRKETEIRFANRIIREGNKE